jgi:hypothetical protein
MGHVLLAAKVTLYLSGLIVFHENTKDKTLDVLLLKGDETFEHHNVAVERHLPYLTISADKVDLGQGRSTGYEIIGGPGPEQLARFPLSGVITLKGAPAGDRTLDKSYLAVIGKGGSCEQPVYEDIAQEEWPIQARIKLKNAVVTPVDGYKTKVVFHGNGCPRTPPTDIAERVQIEVALSEADAMFKWKKGNTRAVLKWADKPRANRLDENISVGIANLPEAAHVTSAMSGMAHDFLAYYSVLEDRDECTCYPMRDPDRGSQPIFCPPSRTPKP